ncbi:MAG TPA: hypothetical protein VF547_02080 [Allosphingosinicella sp.]|jgi:uncharacterized protein YjeT (DUF2065 family)
MEAAIERLAALAFLVTGLSHLLAPRAWVRFFERVEAQGEAAGVWNGLLHLPLGLAVAALHPVWEGPALAVTLIGWVLLAKATAQLCSPALARRSLAMATGERGVARCRIAGAAALAIGAGIGWVAWR